MEAEGLSGGQIPSMALNSLRFDDKTKGLLVVEDLRI